MAKPTKDGLGGVSGEDRGLDAEGRVRTPKYGQRWIVALANREEASRFMRKWHKRSFPWGIGERPKDGLYRGLTIVNAEVLW